MEIIAGKYKFKKIIIKRGKKFKPMANSLRESIFNILNNFHEWKKSLVLDLFAGSGSLGLEALSRGSEFCYFNEINKESLKDIQNNLASFEIKNAQISKNRAEQTLYQLKAKAIKFNLIFIDPPFIENQLIFKSLEIINKNKLLANNGCIVVRTEKKYDSNQFKNFSIYQTKHYGRHWIYFLTNISQKEKEFFDGKKSNFLILSGPSGVGKKKIIEKLFEYPELNLAYSLSMTTRKRRVQEKHWKDYYFVNKKEFEKEIKNDNFLEYAEYVGNYYGTNKSYIQRLINQNKNILFEIEILGAKAIKKKIPRAIWIYLLPPNLEELEKRIRKRGTEDEESIKKRLIKAKKEINYVRENNLSDYYVFNDEIETASKEIYQILQKNWKIN